MTTPAMRAALRWFYESAQAGVTPIGTRTATNATGTASSLTINKPTGTVNGDVVAIAVFANNVAFSTATITPPAGFTAGPSAGGTTNGTLSLFYKVASGEPASYTFTIANGFNDSAAAAQSFTNVSNATPNDGTGGINIDGASGTTHTTPSATPSLLNDCVIVAFGNTSKQGAGSLNNGYTLDSTTVAGSNSAIGLGHLVLTGTGATSCTETTGASCTSRNLIQLLRHA